MSGKSISHCQGKGSLSHNNRDFKAKNVDSLRTEDNITFIKQPIAEAYDECFGASVQRYNEKQSRSDRKITTSYYESIFNHTPCNTVITSSDKRKSFYEDVVQIGTMKDTGCGTEDGKLAAECLTEYMQGFFKRNPNMHVFNAVLHQDEATPHLHIDYIPIGHYKRGIDTQNGLAQALKEQGYTGIDAISHWRESERKVLEEICKIRGIDVSEPKKSRGYNYSCDEYRELQEKIEKNLLKSKNELNALQGHKNELQGMINNLSDKKLVLEESVVELTTVLSEAKRKELQVEAKAGKKFTIKQIMPLINTCDELEEKKKKLEKELEESKKENEKLKADRSSDIIFKKYEINKAKYIETELKKNNLTCGLLDNDVNDTCVIATQKWVIETERFKQIENSYKPPKQKLKDIGNAAIKKSAEINASINYQKENKKVRY